MSRGVLPVYEACVVYGSSVCATFSPTGVLPKLDGTQSTLILLIWIPIITTNKSKCPAAARVLLGTHPNVEILGQHQWIFRRSAKHDRPWGTYETRRIFNSLLWQVGLWVGAPSSCQCLVVTAQKCEFAIFVEWRPWSTHLGVAGMTRLCTIFITWRTTTKTGRFPFPRFISTLIP